MTLRELEQLIADDEGGTVEFKETTGQRGEACKTLCAFLNKCGGTVVFGVTRKGKLTGQLMADTTKRDLFDAFQAFEPAADINVEYVPVDETHTAIVCRVDRGNVQPYVYEGRPYKRVESSTTVMPQEEYERMLRERGGFASDWESRINPNLKLDDIDCDEVCRVARKAVHVGRLDASVDTEDAPALLDSLKLSRDGRFCNGAAVLFGKPQLDDYWQLELKMGWFKGTTDRNFLDNEHVFGNVFKLMDAAMAFCFKHLNLSAFIGGKLERDEELEIPAAALREALVNAFAHRAYDGDCRTVYLAVYEDRVEIKSPGTYPSKFNLTTLYDPPIKDSTPRNPKIAHVLYLCKMIETWGRGIGVMASECQRVGLPLPTTVQEGGYVITTFRRPQVLESGSNLDQGDPDPVQIDPDPDAIFRSKLLQTIRFNPLISRKVLSDELGVSERKVRKALDDLRQSGVILRQGPEHGGIWRISIRRDVENVDRNGMWSTEKGSATRQKVDRNGSESAEKNTETEERIISILRQDQHATQGNISKMLGITRTYVTKIMGRLQTRGAIRRVGPDRGGHWEVLV
ncbi:MAG: putative DNA binding domain-containing protein [Kiritimatiellae bacterium]|nr:putative DNA binding domain-containing protein [Kiritimatiellia bacterium]